MSHSLLREYISEALSAQDDVYGDPDVPHDLSFFEAIKYLSSRFGKAKITLTNGPLDLERNYNPTEGFVNKPEGLWYGCGTTWLDWLEREGHEPDPEEYQIWSLKIDMSKIKSITSEKELQRFSYMYADYSQYSGRGPTTMDWSRASQKFSGIECCPYPVGESEMINKFIWYVAIDVSSGCIWDTSAITNSMLVAEKKEDGWEVYV